MTRMPRKHSHGAFTVVMSEASLREFMKVYMDRLGLSVGCWDPILAGLTPYAELADALHAAGHDTTELIHAMGAVRDSVHKMREVAQRSKTKFLVEGFKGPLRDYFAEQEAQRLT